MRSALVAYQAGQAATMHTAIRTLASADYTGAMHASACCCTTRIRKAHRWFERAIGAGL